VLTKSQVCERIRELGVLPAVRVASAEDAQYAAETVARGGIPLVEITLTIPGAIPLITSLVHKHPKMIVGAGTVLDVETARQSVDAGAHFLTSPGLSLPVMEFAVKQQIAVLPGALSPTEVVTAWQAGADFVKVFPCALVGGAVYIRALRAPMPQIPLMAAGGVTQQTAGDYILAGASAIGVGGELIPAEAIARRQAKRIHELARRFLGFVKEARARLEELKAETQIQS